MNVLLDTNIIIYREKSKILNASVMNLFKWLNKLKYTLVIHPITKDELCKNMDEDDRKIMLTKLEAYNEIQSVIYPDDSFMEIIKDLTSNENDINDNILLYYVYKGRVDCLITEDKKMLQKAKKLDIEDKVYNISSFIDKCICENPELIPYRNLSVQKQLVGDCDISDPFFTTLKSNYEEFEQWFQEKAESECYICKNDDKEIQGFLFLKIEGKDEPYSDITPQFLPKKRLKIRTFRTVATGYRLGERFLKIIFDNAKKNKVDEIYVTLFEEQEDVIALKSLLLRWGFYEFGKKHSRNGDETVLVKNMVFFDSTKNPVQNFPIVDFSRGKYILPIEPSFHQKLFPDALLKNEKDHYVFDNMACRYALQKTYISFAYDDRGAKEGDLLLFYRKAEDNEIKKYKSVISGIGVICSIKKRFKNYSEYLQECKNRTVFSQEELKKFWEKSNNLIVINFIYIGAFSIKNNLKYLYEIGAVEYGSGPRPFTKITDSQFDAIFKASGEII